MITLGETQKIFWDLIRAPEGVRQGLRDLAGRERRLPDGIESLIESRGALGAVERLDIYANMYFYRILDILKEDFPAVHAVLGDSAFHNLVTAYLVDHPSTHPSVRHLGRHLSSFLLRRPVAERPWLADLAALEWAMTEAFDGPDAEALDAERLRDVPPEEWPALRFRLTPTLGVVRSGVAVHAVWSRAVGGEALGAVDREPTVVRVWRRGLRVLHRPMGSAEDAALDRAGGGDDFASVCEAVAVVETAEDAPATAARILHGWFADGLVVAVH